MGRDNDLMGSNGSVDKTLYLLRGQTAAAAPRCVMGRDNDLMGSNGSVDKGLYLFCVVRPPPPSPLSETAASPTTRRTTQAATSDAAPELRHAAA